MGATADGDFERYKYSGFVIMTSMLLYVFGGLSPRQIVKTIEVLKFMVPCLFDDIPAHTTIRTWLSKAGVDALEHKRIAVDEAYAMIVDGSISVGDQELMLALKVPSQHPGHALGHADAEVAAMGVAASWKAQDVADLLDEAIQEQRHSPDYIISDNGNNLRKAAADMSIPHHRDVGHTFGIFLKQVYEDDPEYAEFTKAIGRTKHLALTDVSYLSPPKQRYMARFMNLYPIIDWASSMLENFHRLGKKERFHYSFIPRHASLIVELGEVLGAFEQIMQLLKNEGLSAENASKALDMMHRSVCVGSNRVRTIVHLVKSYIKRELHVMGCDDGVCHNISSDIIESKFGMLKDRMPQAKTAGFTECVLTVPLTSYLGSLERARDYDVKMVMERCTMANVKKWKKENLMENPLIRRAKSIA